VNGAAQMAFCRAARAGRGGASRGAAPPLMARAVCHSSLADGETCSYAHPHRVSERGCEPSGEGIAEKPFVHRDGGLVLEAALCSWPSRCSSSTSVSSPREGSLGFARAALLRLVVVWALLRLVVGRLLRLCVCGGGALLWGVKGFSLLTMRLIQKWSS